MRPDVTTFSEVCEACHYDRRELDLYSYSAGLVEGSLRLEADVGFATCRRGHRVFVRRVARTLELVR